MDAVFKALADPSRRLLLDALYERNGQTLSELCAGHAMARQSVTKHLDVLEAVALITTLRRGREKLHFLNAVPIADLADRWIGKYDRERVRALADLRHALEGEALHHFVYATYIKTTRERLWQALTDPAFTLRYWGAALHSDWKVGSPILWQSGPDGALEDLDEVVLEFDPPRRLAYTWHNYQPGHAEFFGWSQEKYAELLKEPRSRVSFDLEPSPSGVRLTVIHDGFDADTEMLRALSGRNPKTGGWPEILSNLKSLLESSEFRVPSSE